MQRSPADPMPRPSPRPRRARGRRRGAPPRDSWRRRGPAHACPTRPPSRRRTSRWGRAHKRHRLDVRVMEHGVHRFLVAVDHVQDAVRQAGLGCSSSAMRMPADGTFSDGFQHERIPAGQRHGDIHIGTIAGKLNGVITAHTPSGCSREYDVHAGPTFSLKPPLSEVRDAHANSTTSMPRCTSHRVGEHLAVLGGDRLGDLGPGGRASARGTRTAPRPRDTDASRHAAPRGRPRRPPSPRRGRWRGRLLAPGSRRWPGRRRRAAGRRAAGDPLAVDEVEDAAQFAHAPRLRSRSRDRAGPGCAATGRGARPARRRGRCSAGSS